VLIIGMFMFSLNRMYRLDGHSGNCHGIATVVADKIARITKAIVHLQEQEVRKKKAG